MKQTLNTKWLRADNEGTDAKSSIDKLSEIANIHFNLGMQLTKSLVLGLHYANANIAQKVDMSAIVKTNPITEKLDMDAKFSGFGAGITYNIAGNLYLAIAKAEYDFT